MLWQYDDKLEYLFYTVAVLQKMDFLLVVLNVFMAFTKVNGKPWWWIIKVQRVIYWLSKYMKIGMSEHSNFEVLLVKL